MYEKVKELYSKLEEGIAKVFGSEEFINYLKFIANFKEYSSYNLLSIFLYNPNATYVAGVKTWNKLGRWVKKGEKGIPILAPLIIKEKKFDEITGEETTEDKLKGFKVVYVFDISQTEGKEIPTENLCRKITTNNYPDILEKLLKLCKDNGINVVEETIKNRANGYFYYPEVKIALSKELSIDMKIKTLTHELCHWYLWHTNQEEEYDKEEIIVESVSYIVLNLLGIDTSQYSFGYVSIWSKSKTGEELLSISSKIKTVANDIFEMISEYTQKQEVA